jgi:hypothetical protein
MKVKSQTIDARIIRVRRQAQDKGLRLHRNPLNFVLYSVSENFAVAFQTIEEVETFLKERGDR